MEHLSTDTLERGIDESIAAHPSNAVPVFRGVPRPETPLIKNDESKVMEPFGALAVGLAHGVSVRHGIDALRISDTGGEIDGNMGRSEVFNQAKRVEAPETVELLKSKEFMQERRESYLQFLGISEEDIDDNRELIDRFHLGGYGDDALEHVLFGDTRYEELRGKGVLTLNGLHFLPAAEQVGLDMAIIKDKSRELSSLQRKRGVKRLRMAAEGVEKVNKTSLFPRTYIDSAGNQHNVTVNELIKNIVYAMDHAQTEESSSVKDGYIVREFINNDPESMMPSVTLVINDKGEIVSAFPRVK